MFAARLRVPRSFVEDGRGAWVEYDPGELDPDSYEEKEDGLVLEERLRDPPGDSGGEAGGDDDLELKETSRRDPDEDPDLEGPELVNLIFACGLRDDKAPTVLEAIQDVVLYCRAMNIPVLRIGEWSFEHGEPSSG